MMVPTRYLVLLIFSVTNFLRSVEGSGQGSSSCRCGMANIRTTRIIGGKETLKKEFPWMAAFVRTGNPMTWCSATIINSLYVLTDYNCLPKNIKKVEVAIGKHRAAENDEQMRVKVVRRIRHPNRHIHIALLKLGLPIKFPGDNTIAPACLPPEGRADYDGKHATVAGWGFINYKPMQTPKVLMKLSVTVASHAYCKSKFRPYNASTDLCTELVDGKGTDGFHDRGSPLILAGKNNAYSVIGVMYRPPHGDTNIPDMYYSVVPLLPWIRKQTKDGMFCSSS